MNTSGSSNTFPAGRPSPTSIPPQDSAGMSQASPVPSMGDLDGLASRLDAVDAALAEMDDPRT